MPIYPGPRQATWRVIVHCHGKNRERSFSGTKAEAREAEAMFRIELGAVEADRQRSPTLNDFCRLVYIPHAETHLKRSTWWKVRRYQVTTLRAHIGTVQLTKIDDMSIGAFKRARLADGAKPSTINNELRVLGTIMRHAIATKYRCADPKIRRLPVRGDPRVKVWTAVEVNRLYAACATEGPEILPMLVFMMNTGVRKGEACAAEWSWIDEAAGLLRIPSNEHWQPKDGEARDAPISAEVIAAIPRKHDRWIFPAAHGGAYKGFPEETFRRVRRAAGVAGSPHRSRHTYASHFLARVPDMKLLAEVLGHSDTRVTELYSHLLPGHLDRAKNAVRLLPNFGQTLGIENASNDNNSTIHTSVTSSAGKPKAANTAVSKPKCGSPI